MDTTTNDANGSPAWLANFATTPGRIVLTMALMLATGARYLALGVPTEAGATLVLGLTPWALWLLTLTAWAAVDVGQYGFKRFSDRGLAAARATPATSVNVTAPTAATGIAVAGDASIDATGTTAAPVADVLARPVDPVQPRPLLTLNRAPVLNAGTEHAFKNTVGVVHPTGEASDL